MSQMPAAARTATRAPRRIEPVRPHLRVVPAVPTRPRRLPFVVLCSFLLTAGLLLLLFLNMSLAQGAYDWHRLADESQLMREKQQALEADVRQSRSPAVLAERARELGMVEGVSPAFLRLPDGQVLGIPQAAAPAPTASGDATSAPSSTASPSSSGSVSPSTRSGEASSPSSARASSSPSGEASADR